MMKSIAAALMFFTRLPFWRLKSFQIPAQYFSQVINYWAVVGWLTGAVMATSLWLSAQILPYSIAIIIAILARLIITGALHEDGLADFFDGFGGGNTKDRILAIMKDSHIGTYGVVSLIFYFGLFYSTIIEHPLHYVCLCMLIVDPFCKWLSSFLTCFLPYARNTETSKSKVIYSRASVSALGISSVFGILPLVLIPHYKLLFALLFPLVVFGVIVLFLKRKIQGYTGDCCGAMFLMCELATYLGILIVYKNFVQ